ncbi:50S ribosomal protein L3 [Tichowtungia aerotolerans]|uniref:Large ribosomal subunit protein uL3 n=1 Tax=Tichowtungia aerotolerans TaxID=2697043 RepID=A0A6P1MAW2_9BACT|nr:50S ribosomal protein L3 [Tichowtungia aerotolerans]QHI68255.1 50S ribosomal protein L3 [Tichowtungia aerotolerans]
MKSLIGKKLGMTQIFNDEGQRVPVTVIEAGPCSVVQRKTQETDGYEAVQIGFSEQKEHRVNKSLLGHFKKAGVAPTRELAEVIVSAEDETKAGDMLTAGVFEEVQFVDVIGKTKGKGFQGVVRRHGFAGGRASHGGKSTLRVPGSIGQCEFPARVFKGKKMAGQMGNTNITVQNLKVIQVRPEENLVLVKGAVPGANGSTVVLREALKKK